MIENIRLAFQGIWSHMMRSFLTMLGIIIGIASIIAIVSTIKGTSEQIKEDLIGAGSNTVNVYLYDGDNRYDAEYGNSSKAPVLTDDVKEEIMDLDHVENATFYYNSTSASIYNNNNSLQGGSVYGIDVNYLNTCGYVIQSGRGFVNDDYKKYNKVALIDDNAAENLFPSENPVGKTVEINQEPYTIVGVVRQDENYQPTINSIDEYYNYYQAIVGSVMIPDTCWPISFRFDVPQNVIVQKVNKVDKSRSYDMRKMADTGCDEIMFFRSDHKGDSTKGRNQFCKIGNSIQRNLAARSDNIVSILHKMITGIGKTAAFGSCHRVSADKSGI